MKRVLKKNQVMIAALAVMIAAAGYLNYTGRLFGTEKDDTTQTSADLTNQELLDISEEDMATGSEDILSNDSETEGTPGEAVLTNTTAEATVAQAKVSREQVMAQSKEAGCSRSDGGTDKKGRAGSRHRIADGSKRLFRGGGQHRG